MSRVKPFRFDTPTGHTVREDAMTNLVPEGKGLAVIHPYTREVVELSRSQLVAANAYAATRSRVGRARLLER